MQKIEKAILLVANLGNDKKSLDYRIEEILNLCDTRGHLLLEMSPKTAFGDREKLNPAASTGDHVCLRQR